MAHARSSDPATPPPKIWNMHLRAALGSQDEEAIKILKNIWHHQGSNRRGALEYNQSKIAQMGGTGKVEC